MHECPRCFQACCCHGDIDDCVVETEEYSSEHCTCPCEEMEDQEELCEIEPMENCYECSNWIAEMHNGDPLRATGYGRCNGDESRFHTRSTHGSTTCPQFKPNAAGQTPAARKEP